MIEKRPFGRTGHSSSATLFGAAALARGVDDQKAGAVLEVLLERGVNHIDVAASYGDAELRVGAWMPEHRSSFFLATKTGDRTYDSARDSLQRSLERLNVDKVDLIQMHSLGHPDDWDVAMGPGGALEALVDARGEGLVDYIGVTGHGWNIASMHRRSLEHFDFDSVLLPYNYIMHRHARYREEFDAVLEICEQRHVAVQTIKSIALGPWATGERVRSTWYQPLEDQASIDLAVHWVLGRDGVFLNTAGDVELLPRILDAADRFNARPSDAEMKELSKSTRMSSIFGI